MESYTYEQLKEMTVARLREISKGIESDALQGYSTMHKEQLIPQLCKVMGIHTHHAAAGAEKTRIKGIIHKLKARRDEASKARDDAKLAVLRRQIHILKHKLRCMAEKSA